MRFLIFNISVLAALGYLFTASPDQSFSSWLTGTSKTVVAQIDDVMKDGKETIEQSPSLLTSSENDNVTKLQEDIKTLKSDIADLTAHIKDMNQYSSLEASQSNAGTIEHQSMKSPSHVPVPVPEVELSSSLQPEIEQTVTTQVDNGISENVDDDKLVTDNDIAEAFQAIAEADQVNQVAQDIIPENPSVELQYMTPNERIDDLGKLMIDMQVFYLEHSGV